MFVGNQVLLLNHKCNKNHITYDSRKSFKRTERGLNTKYMKKSEKV